MGENSSLKAPNKADELKLVTKEKTAKLAIIAKRAAPAAKLRRRHIGVLVSFVLCVLVPIAASVLYLYLVAADQYSSRVGFSVQSEEAPSPTEILGGIGPLSTGGAKDADVLFAFIQSQQLVEQINNEIDLKALFSKPRYDPVFSFDQDGAIEDLLKYWSRMVKIYYDAGTGLIEIRVNAFSAHDAQLIAQKIFDNSSDLVNSLSAIARDDATHHAKEELTRAQDRLKAVSQAVTRLRGETQIVDPTVDLQGKMGLLSSLQAKLAGVLIEFDLLSDASRASDPRIEQTERKIEVIRKRIDEERRKLGIVDSENGTTFSNLLGRFESLMIEKEFAEKSYLSASAAYDAALADARRQNRYLAAYVDPTLAETPQYPKRTLLVLVITMFSFIGWAILVLIAYSVKDRR